MDRWIKSEDNGRFLLTSRPGSYGPFSGDMGRGQCPTMCFFDSETERELFIVRDELYRAKSLIASLESTVADLRTVQGAGRAYRRAMRLQRNKVSQTIQAGPSDASGVSTSG